MAPNETWKIFRIYKKATENEQKKKRRHNECCLKKISNIKFYFSLKIKRKEE